MTRSDRELARRFKEEADEFWFRDVRFDDALKQKVRDRIGKERAAGARSMRVRKTALGALALASAAALLLVIVPQVSPDRQPASTVILSGAGGPGPSPAGGAGDVLVMEGATTPAPFAGGMPSEGPAVREGVSWTPLSAEEAAEAFGPGLAMPGWLPDGFSLRQIGAFGEREGEVFAVTLMYMSEDRTFWLTLRKAGRPEFFPAWQTVDINGAVGYLNAAPPAGGMPAPAEAGTDGAPPGAPPTEAQGTVPASAPEAPAAPWPAAELHWFAGGVQYELQGAITGEEAVKIARSIPLATEEN
ncbi:MAG: hypothetical protein BAA02_10380 [Paenibacillaceae bacterium ZCTH02-B3]|nr:MAG: hypothetical protein BAA02_10380 [Paenibacillaceae bacterium ZCTH02-B3]